MELQTFSKAIAGFLGAAIAAFLIKQNIIITDELSDALEILLSALITGAIVYLAPKNKGDYER